jgi:hypothetical protein
MISIQEILLDATTWGIEAAKLNANMAALATAVQVVPTVITTGVKTVNGVSPDTNGNVVLTPTSIAAIPSSLIGVPNGIPSLGGDSKVLPSYLPDEIKGGALGFRGRATINTVPDKGFYFVDLAGTYTNFNATLTTSIVVNEYETANNIVLLYSQGQYWKKYLIPIPVQARQTCSWDEISGVPNFSDVAYSGLYRDLTGIPNLHVVATSGNYNDLLNKPNLHPIAISGSFNDLSDVPNFLKLSDCNQHGYPVLLDIQRHVPDEYLTEQARQLGGMMFIGPFTPSKNPRVYIDRTTTDVWCIAVLPGTYSYFTYQQGNNRQAIEVTVEELEQYLVIIYGRTNFLKYRIPIPLGHLLEVCSNPWIQLPTLTGSTAEFAAIDGLKIWLKADSGVVYDENNKVSEWHDASGNRYIFSQSNPVKQPRYIPSIDSMNHKPAIKFQDDELQCWREMSIGTIFVDAN